MAEKQTKAKTRKPARTIEQQIADLQAKAEAQKNREIEQLATKIDITTGQYDTALDKTEKIKARLTELTERYNELVGEETEVETAEAETVEAETVEAETVEAETVEVQRAEVV